MLAAQGSNASDSYFSWLDNIMLWSLLTSRSAAGEIVDRDADGRVTRAGENLGKSPRTVALLVSSSKSPTINRGRSWGEVKFRYREISPRNSKIAMKSANFLKKIKWIGKAT